MHAGSRAGNPEIVDQAIDFLGRPRPPRADGTEMLLAGALSGLGHFMNVVTKHGIDARLVPLAACLEEVDDIFVEDESLAIALAGACAYIGC